MTAPQRNEPFREARRRVGENLEGLLTYARQLIRYGQLSAGDADLAVHCLSQLEGPLSDEWLSKTASWGGQPVFHCVAICAEWLADRAPPSSWLVETPLKARLVRSLVHWLDRLAEGTFQTDPEGESWLATLQASAMSHEIRARGGESDSDLSNAWCAALWAALEAHRGSAADDVRRWLERLEDALSSLASDDQVEALAASVHARLLRWAVGNARSTPEAAFKPDSPAKP